MRLGTQVELPDGRQGTVTYNSMIGVGIKWGLHNPDPKDFFCTDGNSVLFGTPPNWQWEPDALLRDPWLECTDYGFSEDQCVGKEFTIIRDGLEEK